MTPARDPLLPWRYQTWRERCETVVCWLIAMLIGIALFGVGLYVLGAAFENLSLYYEQRDQCLKRATNGYEIERCR
jgi:hypothetical protein